MITKNLIFILLINTTFVFSQKDEFKANWICDASGSTVSKINFFVFLKSEPKYIFHVSQLLDGTMSYIAPLSLENLNWDDSLISLKTIKYDSLDYSVSLIDSVELMDSLEVFVGKDQFFEFSSNEGYAKYGTLTFFYSYYTIKKENKFYIVIPALGNRMLELEFIPLKKQIVSVDSQIKFESPKIILQSSYLFNLGFSLSKTDFYNKPEIIFFNLFSICDKSEFRFNYLTKKKLKKSIGNETYNMLIEVINGSCSK